MRADVAPPRVVRAGRIHTLAGPADALLLRGGRVAAVGDPATLRRAAPDAELLDLGDATVTPGLTDAHVHLLEWALARRGVDLSDADSPEEAARRVAEHAGAAAGGPASSWVRGRGWDPHRWTAAPHRHQLDRFFPDRPVLLQSHDMHSLWANGAALRAAGIDQATADPEGGRIERDPDGSPSGVLRDNAVSRALKAAPAPDDATRRDALAEAQAVLHACGVTGVHTVEPDSLGALESFRAAGRLRLRVLQHLPLAAVDDAIRLGLRSGFGGEWIRVGGIKIFLDGALGSCTAWLREPYEGTDHDLGLATLPAAEFRDVVRRGAAAGLAMTVHAIGDAAVDLALDVLGSEAASSTAPVPHRIEHVQLVAPDRLGGAGRAADAAFRRVVCSVQPSHLMTDWAAADRHWGGRSRHAYAFRSMLDAGATLALGSDAPVDPPDPRLGLFAAVTRTDLAGRPVGGWYPEERLDIGEALAGFTTGAARAAGDARQGRLATGCFADLVAWDRDPLAVEPAELPGIRCILTMVGGDVAWRQE